jgi:sulfite exporter TauE/SafE
MTPLPIAAFALGVLGAPHCVAMCGGVVGLAKAARGRALPMVGTPRRPSVIVVALHAGRLTSYAVAGLLAGGLGRFAVSSWQSALELAAGLAMIGVGLFLCGLLPAYAKIERLGGPLWRALAPITRRALPLSTPLRALAFGAAWGWLPCGLVYSALALAAVSGSLFQGALAMLAFGVGTLPALVSAHVVLDRVGRVVRGARLRLAGGVLVTMLGAVHLTFALARVHTDDSVPACHTRR